MSQTQKDTEEAKKKGLVIKRGILGPRMGKTANIKISKNGIISISTK
jgi:hypothetical protein